MQDLCGDGTFLLDVACPQAFHAWNEARVADHVGHLFGGVTAEGVEFETIVCHKVFECGVCG